MSKWETGEAYPEMNNILELCKIFHCRINDLVNDSIIDVDSLDEEVKMNVVKFKKDQQSRMKTLSNVIAIIARIGKITCWVCVPIVIIVMVLSGIVISKTRVEDGRIIVEGNDVLSIVEVEDRVSLKVNDMIVVEAKGQDRITQIKDILQNNSKFAVFSYVEIGFAFWWRV